jgi:hypothetical protein
MPIRSSNSSIYQRFLGTGCKPLQAALADDITIIGEERFEVPSSSIVEPEMHYDDHFEIDSFTQRQLQLERFRNRLTELTDVDGFPVADNEIRSISS